MQSKFDYICNDIRTQKFTASVPHLYNQRGNSLCYLTHPVSLLQNRYSFLHPGFLTSLVKIVYDPNIDERTTCAALAQLKNFVRHNWKGYTYNNCNFTIPKIDKEYLIDTISELNKELIDNRKYSRIVKDIISFIGSNLFSQLPKISKDLVEGL